MCLSFLFVLLCFHFGKSSHAAFFKSSRIFFCSLFFLLLLFYNTIQYGNETSFLFFFFEMSIFTSFLLINFTQLSASNCNIFNSSFWVFYILLSSYHISNFLICYFKIFLSSIHIHIYRYIYTWCPLAGDSKGYYYVFNVLLFHLSLSLSFLPSLVSFLSCMLSTSVSRFLLNILINSKYITNEKK